MCIRIDYCADSSERAHTVRKCSFVHEIIEHVEYPTPMTRVAKITEMTPRTWGNGLRQQSPLTLSSADNSSVRRALGFQVHLGLPKRHLAKYVLFFLY